MVSGKIVYDVQGLHEHQITTGKGFWWSVHITWCLSRIRASYSYIHKWFHAQKEYSQTKQELASNTYIQGLFLAHGPFCELSGFYVITSPSGSVMQRAQWHIAREVIATKEKDESTDRRNIHSWIYRNQASTTLPTPHLLVVRTWIREGKKIKFSLYSHISQNADQC